MSNLLYIWLFAVCVALVLPGCDPNTRYKVASTIFDGVPTPLPPEQLCKEYAEKRIVEIKAEQLLKETKKGPSGSLHLPYEEKQCSDCHDKSKEGGLIKPKQELCFDCHAGFVKGEYLHGPVATADCTVCHESHTSNFPKLLKTPPEQVCGKCHREKRTAAAMHDKFAAKQLPCVDCHDPHFGDAQFFLK